MTPKEKAKELYNKMYSTTTHPNSVEVRKEYAKQYALIAVDEILKDREEIDGMRIINDPYWLEVKQEIENL